jgi:hypothetical protein
MKFILVRTIENKKDMLTLERSPEKEPLPDNIRI